MRIIIEVSAGPHRGQSFVFEGHDTFLVGRSPRAHFRLPQHDRYFSRIHFVVEVNPPHCRLMDMGSKNGTFVNGTRVTLVDLHDGDQIKGGQTVLRVRVEAGGATPPGKRVAVARLVAPTPTASQQWQGDADPPPRGAAAVCSGCAERPPELASPLCAECNEQARRLPQPVPGFRAIRALDDDRTTPTYLAVRELGGQPVALKVFVPRPETHPAHLDRFLTPAAALQRLSHPYVTPIRELGEANGHLYVAADFVRGTDLKRLVAAEGALPAAETVELGCQLLEALQYAHGEGYVHRDLKPANVMVTPDGMARILNFGLVGLFRTSDLSGLTLQGEMATSLPFLAPEQLTSFREAHPAVDQYAAGAILYFALTGQYVYDFPDTSHQRMLWVLQEPIVPIRTRRPELPAALADVIHRALAKEPAARFPDVTAMLQALSNC